MNATNLESRDSKVAIISGIEVWRFLLLTDTFL